MKQVGEHKHYWLAIGGKGTTWRKSHALARCAHCDAWTVLEFGSLGPCHHVVAQTPTIVDQCPECGQEKWANEECPHCLVDLGTPL